MIITDTKSGNFMVLPKDSLGRILITNKDFEPHFLSLIKNILSTGDIAIDCGANLGYHTVQMGKLVGKNGKIISIEPQRIIFQQMCGNVFMNDLRNVITINAAVGDEDKHIQMDYVDVDGDNVNIGNTRIGRGGEYVSMIRMDDVIDEGVKFIKVDVQGCEHKFLNGSKSLISKSRPIMFVEIEEHHLRNFGTSSENLINEILSLDYIVVRIENEYPCDHVCIPREKKLEIKKIMEGTSKYTVIDAKEVKLLFGKDPINYQTFSVQR